MQDGTVAILSDYLSSYIHLTANPSDLGSALSCAADGLINIESLINKLKFAYGKTSNNTKAFISGIDKETASFILALFNVEFLKHVA